jgi:perosamine synthetase
MEKNFIPVNTPLLGGNELKYVQECIKSGWISSEGPFVKKFEKSVAKQVNRKYGVAVSNGTAAIDIAVVALGIGKGDEVIMPTHTIISCILQVIRSGAKPVLVDSCPDTWNMDISQIESKINNKTKAILAVHLYGLPVEMDKIMYLAKKYKLYVIEDAAEMLGQTYKGKLCGSFGDISTMSFYPNKQITTGEGGMCLTNNYQIFERCKSLRNLCFQPEKRFVHNELGWNYRMTNLQAAVGLAQIEKLDKHITKKREIGNLYLSLLKNKSTIVLPLRETNYAENIFWVFGLVLTNKFDFDAAYVINKLKEDGIGARPFFYGMHLQPVFKKMNLFKNQKFPISDNLSKRGFYIPSGLGIEKNEIERVVNVLNKILD